MTAISQEASTSPRSIALDRGCIPVRPQTLLMSAGDAELAHVADKAGSPLRQFLANQAFSIYRYQC